MAGTTNVKSVTRKGSDYVVTVKLTVPATLVNIATAAEAVRMQYFTVAQKQPAGMTRANWQKETATLQVRLDSITDMLQQLCKAENVQITDVRAVAAAIAEHGISASAEKTPGTPGNGTGKRGRPRKNPLPETPATPTPAAVTPKASNGTGKRGRPRKNPLPETPATETPAPAEPVTVEVIPEPAAEITPEPASVSKRTRKNNKTDVPALSALLPRV